MIALAVGLTAHRQVHAHLGALAHKVILQSFPQLLARALAVAELVDGHEVEVALLLHHFDEFLLADLAHRALLGSLRTFMNVPAYGTTPFLCHNFRMFVCYYLCVACVRTAKVTIRREVEAQNRSAFFMAR